MGLRHLLLIGLSLLIVSCGFHLRGAEPLPEVMSHTAIVAAETSPLRYELESQLLSAGGMVEESRETATALLTIHSSHIRSRVLSVDAQGRASEYALSLVVNYSLKAVGGRVLAQPMTTRVDRDFRFDPDNVLSRGAEREMLEQEMYRIAAQQIIRHLRRLDVADTPPAAEPVPVQ